MKHSLKVVLPALLVGIAGAALIGYYFLGLPVINIGFMNGIHFEGNRLFVELFSLMGKVAILLGAAGFSWFIFKKKMKESSALIKAVGKKIYHFHTVFGWGALILVALHGGYFLITDFSNRNNITGIAAFLILACIAVYGFLVKRFKHKSIKKVHFMLTFAWLAALLVHGGGLAVLATGGLVGLYIALSVLKSEQKEKAARTGRAVQ